LANWLMRFKGPQSLTQVARLYNGTNWTGVTVLECTKCHWVCTTGIRGGTAASCAKLQSVAILMFTWATERDRITIDPFTTKGWWKGNQSKWKLLALNGNHPTQLNAAHSK
jgi:hypothetical protein